MKNTINLFTLVLLATMPFNLISQKLDVQGDSKFRGHIDVSATLDNTSVYVGVNAGTMNIGTNQWNSFFGSSAGYSNTEGYFNSFFGESSGYSNTTGLFNSFFGRASGFANTIGGANSFFGWQTGVSNTEGNANSFFGSEAGYSNMTGNDNSFFGNVAGYINTTGISNSFFGKSAGYSNTEGNANSFFGTQAGYNNSTGGSNSFFGSDSGLRNTSGRSNSFFGLSAGWNNTEGNANSFFGQEAGNINTTGTENTCIGHSSNVGADDLVNATSLGFNASVNANNKVRIGNSGVTVIEGQVDWSFPSDSRFKYNVQEENVPGLDFINLLRPVTYQFDFRKFDEHILKNYPDSLRQSILGNKNYSKREIVMKTGFLAQEVEEICNTIGYHFDGLHKPKSDVDNYSLAYGSFVPLLVKGVQEQQEMIDAQELKINEQEDRIVQLEDHITQQEDRIVHLESLVQQLLENKSENKTENPTDLHVLTQPQLLQNEPNPFQGITRIKYYLPEETTQQASLIISGLDGREIKRIVLQDKGMGAVDIDASVLPAGLYLYSLVVGNSLIDTKKMVHQR